MADRRTLNQLLVQRFTGKELARLVLHNYMDEQSGRRPTFSAADLERARTTLRGRPDEATVYNAWIEAVRIVDYTSLEAIGKALEAEKRLVWVISTILGLLRHGLLRHARHRATRILTPSEWATFPARREQGRRARMAEEKVSFAEVTQYRAWWRAPEKLKARARALPDFEEGSGKAFDDLRRLDAAATQQFHRTAMVEIVELVKACKLRFVHNGKDVSASLRAGKHASAAGEATDLATEAECTLLELVEAGLPEWAEHGQAEHVTPPEFRGPVAVLQEVPPECLDEHGRFAEPGWQLIEDRLRRETRPDKLQALLQAIAAFQLLVRVFLARKVVIEVLGQELGLDLLIPSVRERDQSIRDLLSIYNEQAARSREGEPDAVGFVPPDETLALLRDLRLPLIDMAKLEPDPAEVDLMRQSLATPLIDDWWAAAGELGICGTLLADRSNDSLREAGHD